MRVSDFLKDSHDPRGDLGATVPHEKAVQLANDMRAIMAADRDESLIAASAWLYNSECDQEELIAAWGHMNAGERTVWKRYVGYDMWLTAEKRNRDADR